MSSRVRIAVFAAAFALSRAAAAEPVMMRWTIEGEAREALVFPPSAGDASGRIPLVFAFHGAGGNARSVSAGMRFQDVWPEALVVYPQGIPVKNAFDPEGVKPGWQWSAGQNGDRDVKFVVEILETLRKEYPVDDSRIYAAGFSNGGFFSYALWAECGATFAAFGVCAGLATSGVPAAEPRPVIHIGGEGDRVCNFGRQQESIRAVLRGNGCSPSGESCGECCTSYPSSKGAPVVTLIHPGGHDFPDWATERIVEFFRAHPMGGEGRVRPATPPGTARPPRS